jgi:DNA-binding winged helix-turn-helix (wHTH) protein
MLQIPEMAVGDVVFQPLLNRVRINGEVISLTKKETSLLESLALCEGTMVTRDMLNAVMHRETGFKPSSDHHVDPHIYRLRRKLRGSNRVHIRPVPKHGFKLSVS